MVEETNQAVQATVGRKRKTKVKKKRPGAKKMKYVPGLGKKPKVSDKMKKLFRKRAKEYNSDSDEGEESEPESGGEEMENESDDDHARDGGGGEPAGEEGSDEDDHTQHGAMRFLEGCDAFRRAFNKIMNGYAADDSLGPVLSAHKKLVVAKLAEEEVERKVKKEKQKKKLEISEMGHVKPANFLDTHDKVLIGIATKGVVKFFNAVNKAQMAENGLDRKRFKDAKALTKRRKEAFMSELSRTSQSVDPTTRTSTSQEDSNQPAWAPLRDSFMLTNSKLKDWDKMADDKETEMDI